MPKDNSKVFTDPRGAFAAVLAVLSVIGFIILSITGDKQEAVRLLEFASVPTVFLLGLASKPI